jgi:AraC family transcriptional regulator
MKTRSTNTLIGLAELRTLTRLRPITTGPWATFSGVHLDILDGTSELEIVVPSCDHDAVIICLRSSRAFRCQVGSAAGSGNSCRAGDVIPVPHGCITRISGGLPPLLRAAIDPRWAGEIERIGEKEELERISQHHRSNDETAMNIGNIIFSETSKARLGSRAAFLHHLAQALAIHLGDSLGLPGAHDLLRGESEHEAINLVIERLQSVRGAYPDLSTLAAMSGISRFHFSRLFKLETGMAPGRYIENLRIERAKALIEAAELPLVEIAHQTGFSDQSHFTRRFRKAVGMTPGAYARKSRRKHVKK